MSTAKFVTFTEITRQVIKTVSSRNDAQAEVVIVTPQQVQSIFKCIGFFVSSLFKKTNYDQVVADVYALGSFVRNTRTGASDFIPSHQMQFETQTSKAMPLKFSDSCHRQELLPAKIGGLTQLTESQVYCILQQSVKAIGHFLRYEKRAVILDLGLSSNEVLMIQNDSFVLTDKSKLRDLISINYQNADGGSPLANFRPYQKTLNSPSQTGGPFKLSSENLNGRPNLTASEDQRSVRSKARSLKI